VYIYFNSLGLDIGRKFVGIAVSDKNLTTSKPIKTLLLKTGQTSDFYPKTKLEFAENSDFYKQLGKIIIDYRVKGIIIGLPVHKTEAIKHTAFVEGITKYMHRESIIKLPSTFINEELTTVQAIKYLEMTQVKQGTFNQELSKVKSVNIAFKLASR
jgi:RNase H-fold protein (predicted Holliday junction resolvase)